MKWTSALAIYALLWCFSAFFVLPFHGRRSDQEEVSPVEGQERGAPVHFRPKRILFQMTLVAAVIFGFFYVGFAVGWFDPDVISGRAAPNYQSENAN